MYRARATATSGHKALAEVERSTKAADQARLVRAAMERIGNQSVKPEPGEVSTSLSGLTKKQGVRNLSGSTQPSADARGKVWSTI
jgi:hypothetical protein